MSAEEKVKIYLKPKFNEGLISKEIYKIIMRKCVGKIYAKHKASVPRSEVSLQKVKKLVNEYVEIYKNCWYFYTPVQWNNLKLGMPASVRSLLIPLYEWIHTEPHWKTLINRHEALSG